MKLIENTNCKACEDFIFKKRKEEVPYIKEGVAVKSLPNTNLYFLS